MVREAVICRSVLLVLLAAVPAAPQALSYECGIGVFDVNTRLPVMGVAVSWASLNATGASYTDSSGWAQLNVTDVAPWQLNVSAVKLGWASYYATYDGRNQSFTDTYDLYPRSRDGIIRIYMSDLGLVKHTGVIITFDENGRQKGAYNITDQIQLLVNKNYTFTPYPIESGDLISSPKNVRKWLFIFTPYLFGFGIIVALLSIAAYIIFGRRRT